MDCGEGIACVEDGEGRGSGEGGGRVMVMRVGRVMKWGGW